MADSHSYLPVRLGGSQPTGSDSRNAESPVLSPAARPVAEGIAVDDAGDFTPIRAYVSAI